MITLSMIWLIWSSSKRDRLIIWWFHDTHTLAIMSAYAMYSWSSSRELKPDHTHHITHQTDHYIYSVRRTKYPILQLRRESGVCVCVYVRECEHVWTWVWVSVNKRKHAWVQVWVCVSVSKFLWVRVCVSEC